MGRISEDVIEQIRSGNDVVDIVSEYVQLNRQGRNYFGLCPFHDENSPSFSVSPDKQIFHCFGCGKGGNVITFIMEVEHLTFIEAIRVLGEKIGVELPENKETRTAYDESVDARGLRAYEWLTKFYHHILKHSKESETAQTYLNDRELSTESIDRFQIGYAPNMSQFTVDFLNKKGFNNDELVRRDLMRETDSGDLIDRFRNRVIFPIRNHLGNTVAFGARAIHDEKPKYLNSPETELFEKSKILYNFDLAKRHIRRKNEVILCEGYIDVIACDAAGVPNTVATLGTALTEFQARILQRYGKTVVLCYDADKAGLEATEKAGLLLEQIGCEVKVANLNEGMDPDQYIKEFGSESFRRDVIEASDAFNTFYIQYMKRNFNLNLEGERIRYLEKVTERLATIERVIEREYYLKELASEYNITFDTLQEQVESIRKTKRVVKHKPQSRNHTWVERSSSGKQQKRLKTFATLLPAYHKAERSLIAYMLYNPMIAERVKDALGAKFNIEAHQVIVTYLYAYYEEGASDDLSLFIERLPEAHLQQLVAEIGMIPIDENVNNQVITDYIDVILEEQINKPSIQKLKEEQRLAEKQNDPIRAAHIATQIIELQNNDKLN